jgi:hypothetical protein
MKRIGLLLICMAVVAGGSITVRGEGPPACYCSRTIYDPSTVWLIALLSLGAFVVRFSSTALWRSIGAGICVAIGPQLSGTGVVAYRRWVASARNALDTNLGEVQFFAILLIVAGLVVTAAAFAALWKYGVGETPRPSVISRRAAFAAAIIIAASLPYWMGHGRAGAMTPAALAGHALMYSLPWGFALALTAWLNQAPALAIAVTLPVSAIPLVGQFLMIWAFHPTTAFGMAGLGGAAVVWSRWADWRRMNRKRPENSPAESAQFSDQSTSVVSS